MAHPIEDLRIRIQALNDPESPLEFVERLSVVNCRGLHHLEFYGTCFGEAYIDLCETLSLPKVAASILSLSIRGPDEGANGTRNWDLEPLVSRGQNFPALQTFSVELNQPADHNQPIIASSFEEDGVIARLAAISPRLAYLTIPSAPSPALFDVPLTSLQELSVDAGYDTPDFLQHFGRSRGFPALRSFEWGEFSERSADHRQDSCTPFSDYEALFASPAFRTITRFVLRQPTLTTQQTLTLKRIRPDIQFLLVRHGSEYVRI